MRCERKDLCLASIVIVLGMILFSTNHTYGGDEECKTVSMPVRPFAVNPGNKFMRFDGIINTGTAEHIIGVFIKNETDMTIHNVTASASFKPGSGVEINLTEDTYRFENLEPGIPVLGFFRANFAKNSYGKPTLILDIKGDHSFQCKVERKLFVISSEFDENGDNRYTLSLPEGRLTTEIYESVGGDNLKSAAMPKSIKFSMEYNKDIAAFERRLDLLPYGDPFLTPMICIPPVGVGPIAIDKLMGRKVFEAGMLALVPEEGDIFFIQQKKNPLKTGEVMEKEEVEMWVQYPMEPPGPLVGTGYTADIQWTYTRTTNFSTYPPKLGYYSVRNRYLVDQPDVKIEPVKFAGRKYHRIMVTTKNPHVWYNDKAYAVVNISEENPPKEFVKSIILRDDGHQGDEVAEDGIYTGMVLLPPDKLHYLFASVLKMNTARKDDSPESAAKMTGGIFISTTLFDSFAVTHEKEDKKKPEKPGKTPMPSPVDVATETITIINKSRNVLKLVFIPLLSRISLGTWVSYAPGEAEDGGRGYTYTAREIGSSFSGGVKLSLGHRIGMSIGYRLFKRGMLTIDFNDKTIKPDVSTNAFLLELFCNLPVILVDKLSLRLGAGVDYYKSKIKIDYPIMTFKDSSFGTHLSLGIQYSVTKRLALTLNAEYVTSAKFNEFTPKVEEVAAVNSRLFVPDGPMMVFNGDAKNLTPDLPQELEIDFSGWKLSTGIILRLSLK